MEIQSGLRVKVYFNLRKKCFSIQYKGRVIGHSDKLCLENVEFKVSEAGRQRVLKSKRKNVHAFIIGNYSEIGWSDYGYKVSYNPYESSSFLLKLNNFGMTVPIHKAKSAFLYISDNSIINAIKPEKKSNVWVNL